jgi:hypothetical protein
LASAAAKSAKLPLLSTLPDMQVAIALKIVMHPATEAHGKYSEHSPLVSAVCKQMPQALVSVLGSQANTVVVVAVAPPVELLAPPAFPVPPVLALPPPLPVPPVSVNAPASLLPFTVTLHPAIRVVPKNKKHASFRQADISITPYGEISSRRSDAVATFSTMLRDGIEP